MQVRAKIADIHAVIDRAVASSSAVVNAFREAVPQTNLVGGVAEQETTAAEATELV